MSAETEFQAWLDKRADRIHELVGLIFIVPFGMGYRIGVSRMAYRNPRVVMCHTKVYL